MASCHARAVMLRRKQYRDETDYNIALTVANHMGSDGRPATVSLATIAEYAHCHYNTADRRVKAMTGAGQLITGRSGRYLTYSIPYDGDDGESEGDSVAISEVVEVRLEIAELKEQVAQLATAVVQLSHDLHTIVTRPSHDLHTTFTPTDEDDVTKAGKYGSTEGEKTPQPPARPFKPSPVKSAVESGAEERIKALLEVCNLDPDIPDHVRQAENTAAQLGRKYTADDLRKRYAYQEAPNGTWYWYRDAWQAKDGSPPSLRHVLETVAIELKPAGVQSNNRKPTVATQPKGLAAVEEYARRQQGLKQ